MSGLVVALALAALASDAKQLTSFALTNAEWWEKCPRVLTQAQADRRGLTFKPIKMVGPKYPMLEHHEPEPDVQVDLEVRVALDGRVLDARVTKSTDARFTEPSLTAVKEWRYAPPVIDGEPSCLAIKVTVEYRSVP